MLEERDKRDVLKSAQSLVNDRQTGAGERRNWFRSSTIHSGASSSRDRRVSSLIQSRACCMALSAGHRARNATGFFPFRPRERTRR